MTTTAEISARRVAATPRGCGVLFPFFAADADNAIVTDTDGKQYIDFCSGIAVTGIGHRHPQQVAAMTEQLQHFSHTCYQILPYESYIELAEKINAIAPIQEATKTCFFSTGAEAIENAIKIARFATGRSGVIAFTGAFHGRTLLATALTGKVAPYKLGFGPFPPEIFHAPYPNAVHGVSEEQAIAALEHIIKVEIEPSRIAALIIEPIQGEGGFYVAPAGFMRYLRQFCDDHGIVFIADEVQSGFGRTGKYFGIEHCAVEPDLMTMAKSLAGGMPLSAVCGKAKYMDAPNPGGLGGTYAGNPLAIASALATLNVIEQENLLHRAGVLGQQLRHRLEQWQQHYPEIVDVRGIGAMMAIELADNQGQPLADTVKEMVQEAARQGLLILQCGTKANSLRFLFPLTIADDTLTQGLDILERVLSQLLRKR